VSAGSPVDWCEHDDDRLIPSNDEFGLCVSSPTLDEGIAGISGEPDTLFEVYVEENPKKLTIDAHRLRAHLQTRVPAGANTRSRSRCGTSNLCF